MSENETIVTRIKDVYVGVNSSSYFTWTGIKSLKYQNVDQWVHIKVPYGQMIHQEIGSPEYHGELRCIDFNAVKTALYSTPVTALGQSLIDLTNISTVGAVNWEAGYVVIHMVDQNNNTITATITGFRITTVEVEDIQAAKEGMWLIKFIFDEVVYS
jgi:hypothetical protein